MFRLKKNREECGRLGDALEVGAGVADLPMDLERHLAVCADCQAMAEELSASRALLQNIERAGVEPGPWFVPRVMAAIAARESDLQRVQETWTAVPKLAARLTWISALALVLAGSWLYQTPNSEKKLGNDSSIESLFDTPSGPSSQDDGLINVERPQ